VTVNFGEELGESLYQHESLGGISEDVRLCGFARVAVYTILRKNRRCEYHLLRMLGTCE
jgi:hypothetical protein